jgi:tripeptide aminopeptidase
MSAGCYLEGVGPLAESRGVRECLAFFTREKLWVHEQHVALCRIPAPTFLERERAEWMVEQFRALGCGAEIDRAGNVVAWPQPDSGRPLIALSAHLDTVLAPRGKDDIAVDGDGKLRGPGVSDNGAGLAALLAVARALRSSPPIGDAVAGLVLVANVGEEGEGNLSGMRYLAGPSPLAPRIRAYLVLDGPSLERITNEAVASRRFELVFSGAGGHSWSDSGNANPVHALSRAIASFSDQFPPAPNGSGPRWSFNFGVVEGGSSVNSIPAQARAKVDLRSQDTARIDELAEALTAAVDRALQHENQRAAGAKLAARVKEIGSRPAGRLAEDACILQFLRAVDAHLGIRGRLDSASTDGAHTPSEWYDPEGRDLGLKRILLLAALLMRQG